MPFEQPGIISSFKQGYKTVNEKPYLILFPLGLDLLYLFGPKIKVATLLGKALDSLPTPALADNLMKQWQSGMTLLRETMEQFTVTLALRTFPLGTPSLFSNRLFETGLLKNTLSLDLNTLPQLFLTLIVLFILGILLTFVFYQLIASAIDTEAIAKSKQGFFNKFLSFLGIPFVFLLYALLYLLPGLFVIRLVAVFSPAFASILNVALIFIFIIRIIPMVFSPHAIVQDDKTLKASLVLSRMAVKPYYLKVANFLMLSIGLSYLSNLLWNLPKDGSWFLLVGALGHALITTTILVASFHFFNLSKKLATQKLKTSEEPVNLA